MRKILPLVLSLCGCSVWLSGCEGAEETALSIDRVKPRTPPELPPGLKALMARYANEYFTGNQGQSAVFAAELQRRMQAGEALFLLDVRDVVSFGKGHLAGSVNIPIEVLFQEEVVEALPYDGTPIIVICTNGHTSSLAAGVLGTMGYNAYSLRFGMIGWARSTQVKVFSETQVPQTINGLGGPISQ
jgi:rhodanese-related sulfurtransferase